MKKFVSILSLVLVLSLCLCACGGDVEDTKPTETNGTTEATQTTEPTQTEDDQTTEPAQTEATEPSETEAAPAEYVYTVTVVDVEGNPMPNVFVQICAGTTCVPVATDANGIAGYPTEVTGDGELAAKIITVPEGYACVDGITEISMADGITDVVFTLEPVA